ncbi:MAG: VWA domain-containing protein, partial [Xanthobacteraceae bacterium]
LNPVLLFEGFEARARGIKTMLPYVDEFRPIHNLESIGGLVAALTKGGGSADPKAWMQRVA